MSDFYIYTTGAEFVEGTDESPDRIHSLIQDLGVIPPWQACYINPNTGIVVHIFTAKKREPGSATRKANNYYAVCSDPDAAPEKLLTFLSNQLLNRFNSETTGWERVSSPEDHKSVLSDPDHITNLATFDPAENTLSEEVIVDYFETNEEPLHMAFNTVEQLRQCTWLLLCADQPVLYSTELNGSITHPVGARVEYTTSPDGILDSRTSTHLENAVKRVTSSKRKKHIQAVESALKKIDVDSHTDRDRTVQLIDSLRTIQNGIEEGNIPENIDRMEGLEELVAVIGHSVECIRNEAQPDILDSVPEITTIKQEYQQDTLDILGATIDGTIDRLVDKIIEDSSKEVEDRIDTEVEHVAASKNISSIAVRNAFEDNLDILHTQGGLSAVITDVLSRKTEVEQLDQVSSAIAELNDFIENELVPDLTAQTGLSRNTVENRLRDCLVSNT